MTLSRLPRVVLQEILSAKKWSVVYIYIVHTVFLVIAYTSLYASLVIMGVTFMAAFYWVIDWNFPVVQLSSSILKTPGLSFKPQPNAQTSLIYSIKGVTNTYIQYLDHLDGYLRYYENQRQQGENYIDCTEIRGRRSKDLDKVCRFDIIELGASCVKQISFGFDDGMPCVLLRINKVFGWMPEEYTNETLPEAIQDNWQQWWISLTCEGETPTDKENIGNLAYFPGTGFHFKYFPFRNQQGYRSPLVMVQFLDITPGILLMVTCKVWARNIDHNFHEQTGLLKETEADIFFRAAYPHDFAIFWKGVFQKYKYNVFNKYNNPTPNARPFKN